MGTREIARELDVAYILDGTVECEKPTDPNSGIRINLRLIETSSDTQVWRQSFDCDRPQLFELQSEVAEEVAQHLDIFLPKEDRPWPNYIPTSSTEAHNLVLQGKAAGNYHDAIPLYESAIKLDPNYIEALGKLAWAHMDIYWFEGRSPERLARAEIAARRALALMPDHPLVQMSMARYHYQGHLDYEPALEHLANVRELCPNHTWMLYWTHVMRLRQGDFEEAFKNIRRAFELNPLSDWFACHIGMTYAYLGEYRKAEHYYELAIMRNPNRGLTYSKKAWLYLVRQGDTKKARKVVDEALLANKELASDMDIFEVLVTADLYDREYGKARKKLIEKSQDYVNNAYFIPHSLWLAQVYGYMGDKDLEKRQYYKELEKQYYESAVAILEKKVAENPGDDRCHSSLGKAYAGLGREQKAIEHGLLGVKYRPVDKDALTGPMRLEDLAHIYVMLGKHSEAIDIVEQLLNMYSNLSLPKLRRDPVWDPLRNHPRFKKLIETYK